VLAILEEEFGGIWTAQDMRWIGVGNWPRVNGFIGPGGGVIMISAGFGSFVQSTLLDIGLAPLSAIRLGGAWRVSPTNAGTMSSYYTTHWFSNTLYHLPISGSGFGIETRDVIGFRSPTNRAVVVTGTSTNLDLTYLVNPPRLFYSRQFGIGLTGSVGTAYSIDRVPQLLNSNNPWVSWTNTLPLASGTNWFPNNSPAGNSGFYRARWLPDN